MRSAGCPAPPPTGRGESELARLFARPFARGWYDRPTAIVARELLGAYLLRRVGRGYRAARLVETEAYVTGDPASHAFRGPTARNRSMFGRPGMLYVFRIHQVHCLNAVTRPGEAVLLRAAEPISPGLGPTTGPGRLARSFGLTLAHDGWDLVRSGVRIAPGDATGWRIVRSRRVGISRGRERLLRFSVAGHPLVSRPRAA